jgi:copper homeostasis protein
MLRPRPGGFCYSESEFEAMQRDCELFLQHGAAGVVYGILRDDGSVDVERCRRLRNAAGGATAVFHRAFDVTPDPLRALDELIELGFTRVLTSGQKPTAIDGAELIRQMIDHARGRIEILPGAGVRPNNCAALVAQTGCSQVHLSARRSGRDNSTSGNPQIKFAESDSGHEFDQVDESMVRAVVDALRTTQHSR